MNREATALLRRGIDIDKQAQVIEADNYFRSFAAYRIRVAIAGKQTNIKLNEIIRPALRAFQTENGGDEIDKELFADYAEAQRSIHREGVFSEIFEQTEVHFNAILAVLNGLDAQLVNHYEMILSEFDQETVIPILAGLIDDTSNPQHQAFQDIKNPVKVAKAYLNLLKSAAVILGHEPIKMGGRNLDVDKLTLKRFVNDYALEIGIEINDDDILTLLNSSLSSLVALSGRYEIDFDTTQRIALTITKLIVISRKSHPDNSKLHQIILPTSKEVSHLIEWIIQGIQFGNHSAMTTVCPDYDYELRDGVAHFTGKGLGNNVGLVGSSISIVSPQVVQILEEELGINVNWDIGYAMFEATEANSAANNVTQNKFVENLQESAIRMSEVMGREVGLFPDSLPIGINKEDFWIIKERLSNLGKLDKQRTGMEALGGAVPGVDWVVVGLIASSTNTLILDGASSLMGRHFYDISIRIGEKLNKIRDLLNDLEMDIDRGLDNFFVQREIGRLYKIFENDLNLKCKFYDLIDLIKVIWNNLGQNFHRMPYIFGVTNYAGF